MREFQLGEIFAGYRIEGEIGRGTSGVVYLARDADEEPIAIKVPLPLLQEDPSAVERFVQAAISAGRLHHGNIVPILDAGFSKGLPYIAMERISGPSLKRVLSRDRQLDLAAAAQIIEGVAEAVSAAHDAGIVHGGLNPSQVLFDTPGELDIEDLYERPYVKVKGFGELDVTRRKSLLQAGSAVYLAPEQLYGGPASSASDVYGLGALLYRTVTGYAPSGGIPAAPGSPVEGVIQHAMAANPADRFDSPTDLVEAMNLAIADSDERITGGISGTAGQARMDSSEDLGDLEVGSLGGGLGGSGGSGSPGGGSRGDSPSGDFDDAEPRRSMYARLETPDTVHADREFVVTAGVAAEPQAGVAANEMVVPETVQGDYDLDIEVVADGFRTRPEESWRKRLRVSGGDPYPAFDLHLTPDRQAEDLIAQTIQATYTIEGHTIGVAKRPLWVAREPGLEPAEPPDKPTASDVRRPPPGVEPADLTVNVLWTGRAEGKLSWSLASPHEIEIPSGLPPVDLGPKPEQYAKNLIGTLSSLDAKATLYWELRGKGDLIAEKVPRAFWDTLAAVAATVERKPTVLIASEEPYVPWELATMRTPLDDGLEPYLAVQAAVARWIPAVEPPPAWPPPFEAAATAMAVISGDYSETSLENLDAAREEADELHKQYYATPVNALASDLFKCLTEGDPDVDLLHFAMHGEWSADGYADGLIMVDEEVVSPDAIRGAKLRKPAFVFLNVCQVGAGSEVLGTYAGMAEAFLKGGAQGVVAPLWSIQDKVAKRLALAFYRHVFDEENPVGPAEALRAAREEFTQDMQERSATSMAFRFFGHPNLSFTGRPHE